MSKLPTCKKNPTFPAGHRFRQFSVPGRSPFATVLRFQQVFVTGSFPFLAGLRFRQVSSISGRPTGGTCNKTTTHYTTLHNVRVQDVPDQLGDGGGAHQPPEEGALHDGAGDSVELGPAAAAAARPAPPAWGARAARARSASSAPVLAAPPPACAPPGCRSLWARKGGLVMGAAHGNAIG